MTAERFQIISGEKRRKALLSELHRLVGMVKHEHGDHIAGFALVTWDGRGEAFVATNTRQGPISKHFAATYVAEQIARMASVDDAQHAEVIEIPPKGI